MNQYNSIDINCDLGEYDRLEESHNDAAIMAIISSCNVACGAHAGNQKVIDHTIEMALKHDVQIGAHPSYPDKANFGRKVMILNSLELNEIIKEQIITIKSAAENHDANMAHVKFHGALYNQAAEDFDLSRSLLETVAEVDNKLLVYGLAHSATAAAAEDVGLTYIAEGFADRAYTLAKRLVPRNKSGAVINDPDIMLGRIMQLLNTGKIECISGELIELKLQTLCLHGDHDNFLLTAQVLAEGITRAGIQIKAPLQT